MKPSWMPRGWWMNRRREAQLLGVINALKSDKLGLVDRIEKAEAVIQALREELDRRPA